MAKRRDGFRWWRWREVAAKEHFASIFKSGHASSVAANLLNKFIKGAENKARFLNYHVGFRYGALEVPEGPIEWDTRLGLELRSSYRGNVVAVLGFVAKRRYLLIKQIQGKRGFHEDLRGLKWERYLVAALVELAREAGYEEVRIIKGSQSEWYDKRLNARHPEDVTDAEQAAQARAFDRRYNGTARRAGFLWSKWHRRWIYRLKQ